MNKPVDLYDGHYEKVEHPVYREIRAEAFGVDLGQTSWITAQECDRFMEWAGLRAGEAVLEVACGSGGLAVRLARERDVTVVGVDLNPAGIQAATAAAERAGVADRATFRTADADRPLPFDDGSFDLVFCNDAVNHFRDRAAVLRDWHRVLRPGGRCLYTDPIVVTGPLTNEEIAVRSSIGFFVFTPVGANEQALSQAGFTDVKTLDVTEGVAESSRRWRDARAGREELLRGLEGDDGFEGLQRFLGMVHLLAGEGRLSRVGFSASM